MNYINNPTGTCCCALGESDDIYVRSTEVLINAKTREPLKQGEMPKVGCSYDCGRMFALQRGYTVVKLYPAEAEANAAYDELVNALRSQGRVFEV